ncbi:MAG: alpha-hydroxy-acid oxidizing protein [Alphaproteobacteria bacterium]|nr:alpha-hydroxy-acid oxidizing protein [Alphaproteobacteria bacterium]
MDLQKTAYSLAVLRRMARKRLPRMAFDFIDGGAEDEITRGRNESDFNALEFIPHPLMGTSTRDLSIELFGQRLDLPVLIGPTGLSGMVWPKGEVDAAEAAHDAGTVYVMSHASTVDIEDLANQSTGAKWFQTFMYRDRGLVKSFAERAKDAGYKALVLTIDNQVLGQRERDLENGFVIPPRPKFKHGLDVIRCLPWLLRMARAPRVTMANYVTAERSDILSLANHVADLLDPAMSWRDVDWLRSIWSGPLLLKGVLHPEEARLALDHGIDGLIVSNHGGRQLDGAISAIRALPAIVDEVDGRLPVLIDGGIRRGSDVVKALALGATACLIGRPHLFGLAVGGKAGVARMFDILRADIDRVLMLGGWDGLGDLNRRCLSLRSDWRPHGLHGDNGDDIRDRLFASQEGGGDLVTSMPDQRDYGLWRSD